jgi:hypothetical protein
VILQYTWRLEDLTLFLFGTTMACLHVRFLLIFVPLFAPAFVGVLARWIPIYDAQKDKLVLNAALIGCAFAAMILYFPSRTQLDDRVAAQFPVGAVEYLINNQLAGPMFNNYGFGGYLVWSLGPEYKVFIDGRGDAYERGGVLSDYVHISGLKPGALDVLRGYGVQSCVLRRDEPLATVLYASPEWRRVYRDDITAIFVRTKPWS